MADYLIGGGLILGFVGALIFIKALMDPANFSSDYDPAAPDANPLAVATNSAFVAIFATFFTMLIVLGAGKLIDYGITNHGETVAAWVEDQQNPPVWKCRLHVGTTVTLDSEPSGDWITTESGNRFPSDQVASCWESRYPTPGP